MKNLTALLLAVLLVLSMFSASAYKQGEFPNGDVNRDGKTKIQDANLIQQYKVGMKQLDDEQKRLADYNFDGKVDILDVTEMQMVLAEVKPAPSEPATETTQPVTVTQPTTETQPATQEASAPNPQVNSTVRVYFSNNVNWTTVYFYIYASSTGTPQKAWPGTQITKYTTNTNGEKVYYADVDTSKYDRIIFNNNNQQTINVPVNKASSGFFISNDSSKKAMLVGTYAYTGADKGNMTKLSMDYPGGYKKRVWIWTPADYKATGDKFRTIYMTDGQNLFDDDHEDGYGGWEVTDAVESMMANGGRGVIIVGIESTGSRRDTELTPDIGELNPQLPASDAQSFKNGKGIQFADFVANTVMPYVQENYNSSKAKQDNMIAGSSSGGIESFYIGMEYNDKFGMIGALSPAFLLFGDDVWNTYLSKFDLTSSDMPKLYLFNGNNANDSLEQNLKTFCDDMYNRLNKAGYKKMTYVIEDEYKHNEAYWRAVFPDCISWLLGV
ncbi:MAG: starch-binding protein [Ruminococcus sp.]|nr:starch-binding protein [Ruminococcus sp.]